MDEFLNKNTCFLEYLAISGILEKNVELYVKFLLNVAGKISQSQGDTSCSSVAQSSHLIPPPNSKRSSKPEIRKA